MPERLTFKSARIRSVSVPLRRPVVSKVGLFTEWPLILIDLYTNEGVIGHSYLEPYLKHSSRYIIPAIEDLVAAQIGKPLAHSTVFRPAGARSVLWATTA
jgi:mandelate racemase